MSAEEVASVRALVNEVLDRPTEDRLRLAAGLLAAAADRVAEARCEALARRSRPRGTGRPGRGAPGGLVSFSFQRNAPGPNCDANET